MLCGKINLVKILLNLQISYSNKKGRGKVKEFISMKYGMPPGFEYMDPWYNDQQWKKEESSEKSE